MQTSCPKCSNRLVIDDAKVPAGPFMLKCPKCQATVKVPGKGGGVGAGAGAGAAAPAAVPPPPHPPSAAAPTPAPAPAAGPPAPSAAAPPPPSAPPPAAAAPPPEPSAPTPPVAPAPPAAPAPPLPQAQPGSAGKALVSLPSGEQASAVSTVLGRLGYTVEVLGQADDKLLRFQQGDYDLVATSRNGVTEERNLYRMAMTLGPDLRRRMFLMLVGDEFQTGEGTQAFALVADLVVNSKDVAATDRLVAHTVMERRRLFQTFLDAEDRKVEGKL